MSNDDKLRPRRPLTPRATQPTPTVADRAAAMGADDANLDLMIRRALAKADTDSKLGILAAIVGMNEVQLRRVMNGAEELNAFDRAVLAAHLEVPVP